MEMLLSWLSGGSLLLGMAALLVGALGLVRLPNLFSRIHAVGMMDTAGVALITLGMLIHEGFSLVSVKLAVVGVFLFFTSPIATHAVAGGASKRLFAGEPGVEKGATKAAKRQPRRKQPKDGRLKESGRKATVKTAGKKAYAKKKSARKEAS